MARKEPGVKFKGKRDKQSAKEDFINLLNHPAWQRITTFYDQKISYLEKILNGDEKNEDGTDIIVSIDDLKRYRDKRNMALQFRNLPDIFIAQEEIAEIQDPNFDPFE